MSPKHQSTPCLLPRDVDASGSPGLLSHPASPSKWGLLGPSSSKNPSRRILSKLLDQVHSSTVEERNLFEQAGLARGTEVDLVLSGGGLRGYYCCGAAVVLAALQECHGLRIRRLSGASAGKRTSHQCHGPPPLYLAIEGRGGGGVKAAPIMCAFSRGRRLERRVYCM